MPNCRVRRRYTLKGIIVYQSKWGNCKQVAEAIAKGLAKSGHEVDVMPVASAGNPDAALDFIAIGGPTHMAKATKPITRFIKLKVKENWAGKPFATFSTGYSVRANQPNTQASERTYELLQQKGLVPLSQPFKAGVNEMKGVASSNSFC